MLNRPLNAVTARLAIVAAALALLMLVAPVVFASSHVELEYEEGRTDAVATFSASDEDGDETEWTRTGDDAAAFEIDEDASGNGVLTFKKVPNYESPGDKNKNNVYLVTVKASEASSLDVEITVTDKDEDGKVTLSQPQPQVGRSLTAELTDPDADVADERWQWSRGSSSNGPWTEIDDAISPSRPPVTDDLGMYLQATVTYDDKFGTDKTASKVTENDVEDRTTANAAPSFDHLDTDSDTSGLQVERDVDEGVKGATVGKPIMAEDDDGDVLLYTLGGTDKGSFTIDSRTGQLKTKDDKLNSDDDGLSGDDDPITAPEDLSGDTGGGEARKTVTVTATDPSGASTMVDVTITINDINDAPKLAKYDAAADQDDNATVLYVVENAPTSLSNSKDATETAAAAGTAAAGDDTPTYEATDDDEFDAGEGDDAAPAAPNADPPTPAVVALKGSVEGADKKQFKLTADEVGADDVDPGNWTLAFADDHKVNFEDKAEYSITIMVEDDDAPEGVATVDVTVMVIDAEDGGTVTLSQLEPQVGKPVLATLKDDDGDVFNPKWQWQRANDELGVGGNTANSECSEVSADDWTDIPDANSPIYTPTADDIPDEDSPDANTDDDGKDPKCLRAMVSYTDGYVTPDTDDADEDAGDDAAAITVRDVQAENPANTAPKFADDQDPNTSGKQADAERMVAENAKGAIVGDPVTAVDDDNDLMLYSISDMESFSIDRASGQIKTKVELDYEGTPSYMVVVTATDPSGAADTINVSISVTDEDDKTEIAVVDVNGTSAELEYEEGRTDPVATFSASDEDDDAIEWTRTGDDAAAFEIDEDASGNGVLTFKKVPNYESPGDKNKNNVYLVTVKASEASSLDVEITVTDKDEDGKVTLSQPQPQVGRSLTAELTDPDADVADERWQWSRGSSSNGPWTEIDDAISPSRPPVTDDLGMYLQATVTYDDKFGTDKTASKVTENDVEDRTTANAAPSFDHLDTDSDTSGLQVERDVDEGVKGATVGKPIMAEDDDGDVLLYTLGGTDKGSFTIDSRTGQLKTKDDKLNSDDDGLSGDDDPITAPEDLSGDTGGGEARKTVTVTATDPSGASTMVDVTITINDINDAPKLAKYDAAADQDDNATVLYVVENAPTSLSNSKDATETAAAAGTAAAGDDTPTYEATDDDEFDAGEGDDAAPAAPNADPPTPAVVALKGSVEGADKKQFKLTADEVGADDVDPGNWTLAFADDHKVNFEDKAEYSITIMVEDDDAPEGVATVDVTVMVIDAEDGGTVTLSQLEPQVGKPVLATLKDDDGDVFNPKWQWERANDALTGGAACSTVADNGWGDIPDANSPIYTPTADDMPEDFDDDSDAGTPDVASPRCLRATVSYTDGFVTEDTADADSDDDTEEDIGDDAAAITERDVQAENPANTAPKFADDQDPNTSGKQADAERMVAENAKGAIVGDPVTAVDDDGDLMLYSISDMESFSIDRASGQIKTKVELDYETTNSYMVVVTATDPSGAADTINVSISVTDEDDKTVITAVTGPMPEPGDTCGMAEAGSSLVLDCRTLLDIMDDLVGDGTASLNWSEDTSIGDWDGVASGTGRVAGIWLPNRGLAGTLPAGITALDALERLTLTDNDLTGEIPDLTGLDSIERLVLGGNAFTGGIPASLGNLDSLLRLWLHRNEGGFEGGIPAELGNLSNIRYLMLYGNGLTGEIPSELGNATNLKALYLHNNMLTGSIPAELGNLMTDADDTVRLLYLHNNMLSGDVPAELGNLTSLTALRLSGNMLTGCIPAAIADAAVDADRAGLMACAP